MQNLTTRVAVRRIVYISHQIIYVLLTSDSSGNVLHLSSPIFKKLEISLLDIFALYILGNLIFDKIAMEHLKAGWYIYLSLILTPRLIF